MPLPLARVVFQVYSYTPFGLHRSAARLHRHISAIFSVFLGVEATIWVYIFVVAVPLYLDSPPLRRRLPTQASWQAHEAGHSRHVGDTDLHPRPCVQLSYAFSLCPYWRALLFFDVSITHPHTASALSVDLLWRRHTQGNKAHIWEKLLSGKPYPLPFMVRVFDHVNRCVGRTSRRILAFSL